MALGTFTLSIDGRQLDGGPETTAHVKISVQGRSVIADQAGNELWFPVAGKSVSLPYSVTLPSDVTTGTSTEIGYEVLVTTRNGGRAQGIFAARAVGTTVYLADLVAANEVVVTDVADAAVSALVSDTTSATRGQLNAAIADSPKVADRRVTPGQGAYGATAVNVVQGHEGNEVASDVSAAVIGGGGQDGYNNVVGGDGSATVNTSTPNASQTGTNANYSVIFGGYDNVAGGLASVIGGFHNYTALGTTHGTILGGSANKITKPGDTNDYSTIGGGTGNTASGTVSTIGGGQNNTASGTGATVLGGTANTASGDQSATVGSNNLASGTSALAMGNRAVARETGQFALASTRFAVDGDQQTSVRVAGVTTTDATTTSLTMQTIFPVSSSQVYSVHIVGRDTSTGDTKAWRIDGVLRRGSSGAVVEVGGTPTPTLLGGDAGAGAWTLGIFVGTGTYNLRVTGEAAKTIRWTARMEWTEVA